MCSYNVWFAEPLILATWVRSEHGASKNTQVGKQFQQSAHRYSFFQKWEVRTVQLSFYRNHIYPPNIDFLYNRFSFWLRSHTIPSVSHEREIQLGKFQFDQCLGSRIGSRRSKCFVLGSIKSCLNFAVARYEGVRDRWLHYSWLKESCPLDSL